MSLLDQIVIQVRDLRDKVEALLRREIPAPAVTKTGDTMTGPLDVVYGAIGLVIGANNGTSTRTDTTAKTARVGAAHYTNAEEPVVLGVIVSNATGNFLFLGGGTGIMNAATEVRIYTGATPTTPTGTPRMYIDANGRVGVGVASPTARLHLPPGVATINGAPLKLSAGPLLTTPEDGTFEFFGGVLYFTTGGVRKTVTLV
jgi:hypothetical protein